MKEARRLELKEQTLAAVRLRTGESRIATHSDTSSITGAIPIPGIRIPGEISSMLAPRTETEQLRWNVFTSPKSHSEQLRGYEISEKVRRVPLVGEYIADALVHHTLKK